MDAELGAVESDFARAAQSASLTLSLVLLPALVLSLSLENLAPLSLAGPIGLSLLVLRLRGFSSGASVLPNLITALRVALSGLMGIGSLGEDPRSYAALVLLIFTLDGVDGTLARRLSASSRLGAHFDMEADGYLMLMLCSVLALRGVGHWVLLAGLLRYGYVVVTCLVPSRGEAPASRFGRYAFSLSLMALTLALISAPDASRMLAGLGTSVLVWSFGRSFYWALRGAA